MLRPILLATLMLTAAFVGCLGTGEEDLPGDDDGAELDEAAVFDRMFATDDAHDHADPGQHELSHQMALLDHLPLAEPGEASGTHALAIRGDRLFASSTLGDNPGFAVVNISQPSQMEVMGEWRKANAVGGDRSITVDETGRWVFLANEGDLENQEPGIRVVDAQDPSAMEEVLYVPVEGGVHTIETITIEDQLYVFALNYGVQTFRMVESPAGIGLVKVGQYTFAGPEMANPPQYENNGDYTSWALRAVYAHDMRAQHDPELGPLLYVAYAYQGLHVLNIERPEAPQLLTTWVPEGEDAPWYTHTVEAEMVGDQRLVVVGSEVFEDRHTETPSPLWVLDMTNIEEPEHLSTWTNPAGAGADHLLYSAHFFRLDQGRVHLAHYHGGTWVLDLSTPEAQQDPQVLGAYLPHQDNGFRPGEECCLGFKLSGIPMTFDAATKDGVTFAADYHSGLYALQADELR